jgi:serine/threonine protein kinase
MLEEAKAMIRVAKHDNIVNFLGISMDGEKVYILQEFCSLGSIDSFLEKNSENFRMKMECGNYKEVVSWFVQVADAMDFLVKNNIIHVSTLEVPLELEIRQQGEWE